MGFCAVLRRLTTSTIVSTAPAIPPRLQARNQPADSLRRLLPRSDIRSGVKLFASFDDTGVIKLAPDAACYLNLRGNAMTAVTSFRGSTCRRRFSAGLLLCLAASAQAGGNVPFHEDFDDATTQTLLTTGYRSIPGQPSLPMFHSSALSRTAVVDGALEFMGAVFSIGNTTADAQTAPGDTGTSGIFDLSQEYTISFCFIRYVGDGTRRLQIQVDNNTSGAANSIHGTASRIFNEQVQELTPGQVYSVTSSVGTPTSFFVLRQENNGEVLVDNISVDNGPIGSATCPDLLPADEIFASDFEDPDGGGSSSWSSSSLSDPDMSNPPEPLACAAANTVPGFASLGSGTIGGQGGREVIVSTGLELAAALETQVNNPQPLIIWIDGEINPGNSGTLNKFDIKDMDNVSVLGLPGASFVGIGIKIWRANNIVIRNLIMRHVDIGEKDHISLDGPSSNVWIDHNHFYNSLDSHQDYFDELVSGKGNIDNITLSYNVFHDSWKTSLWGSGDSNNFHRRISFIGNRWENVNSRLPLFRFGEGHVLNSYYRNGLSSGINVRMGANMRIDSSHFENVVNPVLSMDSSQIGFWDTNKDNVFLNVTWTPLPSNCNSNPCAWGNTPGTVQNGGQIASTTHYVPPYAYVALPGEQVRDFVVVNAGVGRVDDCLDQPIDGGGSSSSSSSSDPPGGALDWFEEDFDEATTKTLLTTGYRALPDHPDIAMFHSSAVSRTAVVDGALQFRGAVFSIGNTTPTVATTSGDASVTGIFDMSQEYTVSFCFVGHTGDGTRRLQVQVDNNTSGGANSMHGNASRIFNQPVQNLTPNTVYSVTSSVGTEQSFFALRMEDGADTLIDNVHFEHGSSGSASCNDGGGSSSSSSSDPKPDFEFDETFDTATTATLLTTDYRALPDHPSVPMFHSTQPGRTSVVDGAARIENSVIFSIGNTTPTTPTTSSAGTSGVFDLSQVYTLSFCIVAVDTPDTKKLQVLIDNNTTGAANSPHGNASRIYNVDTSTLTPGQLVSITSSVGSASSFVAIRVESGTDVTFDNVRIEHGGTSTVNCASD